MISKAYEKADFTVIEFQVDDVLTSSAVVQTTLPGAGVTMGDKNDLGNEFDYSDFFQQ